MNLQDILGAGARFLMPNQVEEQEDAAAQEQIRQQRMARGQAARLPYMTPGGAQGPAAFMNFANAAMAPGMSAHSNAVGQVNDAVSREMQSRVAQAREMRRMQHEKDMKRMEIEAMLARIQQARG
jgi:hypothetical protein